MVCLDYISDHCRDTILVEKSCRISTKRYQVLIDYGRCTTHTCVYRKSLWSDFCQIETATNFGAVIWRCLCSSVLFDWKVSWKFLSVFKHRVEWTIIYKQFLIMIINQTYVRRMPICFAAGLRISAISVVSLFTMFRVCIVLLVYIGLYCIDCSCFPSFYNPNL